MAANDACPICNEAITNPICVDCLEKELNHWRLSIRKIPMRLKKIYMAFPKIGKCIICGKETSVCAHCYAEDALKIIKEDEPELEEEFLTHFNYDLEGPP